MIQMTNFMLCVFCHNEKYVQKEREREELRRGGLAEEWRGCHDYLPAERWGSGWGWRGCQMPCVFWKTMWEPTDVRSWVEILNLKMILSLESRSGTNFKGCVPRPTHRAICKQGICAPLILGTHSLDFAWVYNFVNKRAQSAPHWLFLQ